MEHTPEIRRMMQNLERGLITEREFMFGLLDLHYNGKITETQYHEAMKDAGVSETLDVDGAPS